MKLIKNNDINRACAVFAEMFEDYPLYSTLLGTEGDLKKKIYYLFKVEVSLGKDTPMPTKISRQYARSFAPTTRARKEVWRRCLSIRFLPYRFSKRSAAKKPRSLWNTFRLPSKCPSRSTIPRPIVISRTSVLQKRAGDADCCTPCLTRYAAICRFVLKRTMKPMLRYIKNSDLSCLRQQISTASTTIL